MKRIQTYTVDGQTYNSLDEMPSDIRKRWDAFENFHKAMFGDGTKGIFDTARSIGTTDVIIEPGTAASGSDLLNRLSSRKNLWGTALESREASEKAKTKLASAFFTILLLAVLALFLLTIVSQVRITVHYGRSWTVLCGIVVMALVCSSLFVLKRLGGKVRFTFLIASTLGFAVLAYFAVFGGIPIVGHYFTAHPGEMLVTVTAKETDYARYSCRPRLKIAEFTFVGQDHLCPDEQAFAAIDVGTKIRLEGNVSRFGVEPHKLYWMKKLSAAATNQLALLERAFHRIEKIGFANQD